jgi:DNA-directed RNA polymerase specialized sigma24 family protein
VEGRPLDEAELVERAKGGDHGAYGEIVHAYQGIAFRTAYLIAGDASEAEDAAQEGFVKAFYALPRFRSGAPLRPWLLRIVANEARNRRRSAGRRAHLALQAAGGPTSRCRRPGTLPRGRRPPPPRRRYSAPSSTRRFSPR